VTTNPSTESDAVTTRDAHIAALEAQCAALQGELAALRGRVDPSIAVVPPERSSGGNAVLEIFWKTAKEEFSEAKCVRALIPMGGFVSTRYFELPAEPAVQLRIDPGAQPGLWIIPSITLHNLNEEGALIQPALATWEPANKYYGMAAVNGAMILPTDPSQKWPAKILSWSNDPQLLINLPQEAKLRTRILGISCAALDSSHALMAGYGEHIMMEMEKLQALHREMTNPAKKR
jgi:hypothetical protein